MVAVVVAALLLLILGLTILAPFLNAHEHPGRFILYWIACGWLTLTAILLAVFDLLIVRWQSRRSERALRDDLKASL